VREGFRLGFNYQKHKTKRSASNMHSAAEHPWVVQDYLLKECREGRVVGPLPPTLLPQAQVSRFGVIPKKNGQWRLILDLSSPQGHSVNDGINRDWCSLSYVKVEDAAREISRLGTGAILAKVDVKSAYRIIPVHPDDRPLLGMMWDGNLFIDCALPFGLRSAPRIFSAVADVLEWRAIFEGIPFVLHYLDDFLIISQPGSGEGSRHLQSLLALFERLRVPVAPEKVEGPTTKLTFLGIEIDSELMILRLPHQKLRDLRILVTEWLEKMSDDKPSCSVKDLQSLVGSLSHACKVVRPGRTFLRRMFQLLKGCKKNQPGVRLNLSFLSDLMWWHLFLEDWNGISMLENPEDGVPDVELHSDASGSFGCGAWTGNLWLQLQWPDSVSHWSIAAKELAPIVIAALLWGDQWNNKLILVHCDNQAVVDVINSGSSKDDILIMHLLRCIFFVSAHHSFAIRAVHIPGKNNTAADAISRNNLALFFTQVLTAQPQPCTIPQSVVDLVVRQRPDWLSPNWSRLFRNCLQQVQRPPPRKCTAQEQAAM